MKKKCSSYRPKQKVERGTCENQIKNSIQNHHVNSIALPFQQTQPVWELEVERLLKHPFLERLIGISNTQFRLYLRTIREVLPDLNAKGQYREYETSRQITRRDKVHLFITMYWLLQYSTVVNFETIFGIPRWAFTRLVNRTLIALDSTVEDATPWPTDDEYCKIMWKFRDVFPTKFRQLAVIVDGTEIRISRSKDPIAQKATYSVKKKQHSVTLLLMCTPDGKLIHCRKS